MIDIHQKDLRNRILSALPVECFDALKPYLEAVNLPRGQIVVESDEIIKHIYFPEIGVFSVLTCADGGHVAEAGIYGRDGMGPLAAVFGADRAPQRVVMQTGGFGHRLPVYPFREAMARLPALRDLVMLYAQTFTLQVAFTAMSNAVHMIEKRLARWLLMCHDRSESDEMSLTHEFLALMLCVRRPGVTVALHVLEGHRFIRSGRGSVAVRDRAGLEAFAADAYGRPEAEYRRLVGDMALLRATPAVTNGLGLVETFADRHSMRR